MTVIHLRFCKVQSQILARLQGECASAHHARDSRKNELKHNKFPISIIGCVADAPLCSGHTTSKYQTLKNVIHSSSLIKIHIVGASLTHHPDHIPIGHYPKCDHNQPMRCGALPAHQTNDFFTQFLRENHKKGAGLIPSQHAFPTLLIIRKITQNGLKSVRYSFRIGLKMIDKI